MLDLAIITGYYSLLCSAHGVPNARMLQSTALRWRESLFFLSSFPLFFPPPSPLSFFSPFFFLFVSIPLEPSRTRRFVKYRATTLLPLRGRCRRGREKKRRVINYRRIYATRDDEESVEPFGKHYQTCYRFVPCPLLYFCLQTRNDR